MCVLIDRRPAEVFWFLSEPEHLALWQRGIQSARRTSDGPMGVGATFEQTVWRDGRVDVHTSEVLAYEPTHQLAWLSELDDELVVTRLRLEAVDGRTLVSLRRQVVTAGVAEDAPADELRAQLLRLRDVVEGRD